MRRQNPDRSVEESQTNAAARRAKGEFMRGVSQFRSALGSTAFPAEAHRYHLYVALNCPWSHRVTLARNLLGLQHSITLDVPFQTAPIRLTPRGQTTGNSHQSGLPRSAKLRYQIARRKPRQDKIFDFLKISMPKKDHKNALYPCFMTSTVKASFRTKAPRL